MSASPDRHTYQRLPLIPLPDHADDDLLRLVFWRCTALLAAKGLVTPEQVLMSLAVDAIQPRGSLLRRADVESCIEKVRAAYAAEQPLEDERNDCWECGTTSGTTWVEPGIQALACWLCPSCRLGAKA